jgi:hypothetical protein
MDGGLVMVKFKCDECHVVELRMLERAVRTDAELEQLARRCRERGCTGVVRPVKRAE